MGYTRDAEQHVHRTKGFALPGARQIQCCIPDSPALRGQLDAFARIWAQAQAQLQQHRLSRLGRGIDVVFTERRGYYARFWRGHILCVNLKDLVDQGDKAPGIVLHELGHRIWFHVATKKTRARWAADHHERLKIDRAGGSFVSSYAKKNSLEDHAEAFRARVEGGLEGHAKTRYERLGPLTRTIQLRLRG